MAKNGGPTVSKDDLTVIKAMPSPPPMVKETLTATAMLLGYTEEKAKVSLSAHAQWTFHFYKLSA